MAGLDQIVNILLTRATATVSRASFSLPLIAGYHTHFDPSELIRTYNSNVALTSMIQDGFTAEDTIYKAAQVLLSQNPRPRQIKIGKLTSTWTQTISIVPTAANATIYSGRVNDQPWTFTSDADALLAEVVTGIASAIDALDGVTAVSAGGTAVTVSVTAPATLVNVSRTGAGAYTWKDTTAAGTIATEIAALRNADKNWYGLVIDRTSEAAINAVAAWAETDVVLFLASTADSGVVVDSVTDDIASDVQDANYKRTSIWVHQEYDAFLGAGILGAILPFDPGSATWAHKAVAGVRSVDWTASQQAAALSKRANIMVSIAGLADTQWGTSGSDYLDNVQGEDWVRATMQEDIYAFLHGSSKIPYTDRSVARLKGVIEGVLQRGIDRGIINGEPGFVVDAPLVEDVSPTDRANRVLPDVTFSFYLSGAIHVVDPILGLVSL